MLLEGFTDRAQMLCRVFESDSLQRGETAQEGWLFAKEQQDWGCVVYKSHPPRSGNGYLISSPICSLGGVTICTCSSMSVRIAHLGFTSQLPPQAGNDCGCQ